MKTDAPVLPRRFYKQARAAEIAGGFGVHLDAHALKTPGGASLILPTRALADLCAAEWEAQGEHIAPASMPVSQFAFAALDWTSRSRDEIAQYVASFGETDLCCHRANAPAELVARQAQAWDPLVAWASEALQVTLPVVVGVMPLKCVPFCPVANSGLGEGNGVQKRRRCVLKQPFLGRGISSCAALLSFSRAA